MYREKKIIANFLKIKKNSLKIIFYINFLSIYLKFLGNAPCIIKNPIVIVFKC